MINVDLSSLAKDSWNSYLESISKISMNYHSGIPLIENEKEIYNFDKINSSFYSADCLPSSADGLEICSSTVNLIEFKCGFKKRITKYNFDKEKAGCKKNDNQACDYYWREFFKRQEKETSELISQIKLKALESYLTLEKKVFPLCSRLEKSLKVRYVVVVDVSEIEDIEASLSELAGVEYDEGNIVGKIKQSLKRFNRQVDACGNDYLYDEIEVISSTVYSERLRSQ